jgi:lysyl-tRNA synthetase class II
MDEMLQDFLTEAGELLSGVDNKLVDLEKRPGDAGLLNEIFRGFHTIKGGAGFLNLTAMVDLCHLTENVFDLLRRNELKLNANIMDAILEATGIDIDVDTDLDSLGARIEELQLRVDPHPTWGKQVDELLKSFVEPMLVAPTFIMDYPAEISPFAKKKPENPRVVERFEPFVAGLEVGNAFTELNDPEDQFLNFLQQQKQRAAGDVEAQQMDEDYVQALKHGLPPTGGLGLGIDRMAMLFTDQHSIRDVVLYPQLRT